MRGFIQICCGTGKGYCPASEVAASPKPSRTGSRSEERDSEPRTDKVGSGNMFCYDMGRFHNVLGGFLRGNQRASLVFARVRRFDYADM